MFQVNDTILYGADGVCVITEIAQRTFDRKTKEYYVLSPVYGNQSVIYVPTQSEKLIAKMRKVLSAEEIYTIIRSMPETGEAWIDDESARKQRYAEILHNGDRQELIHMIKALYLQQQSLRNSGRKFHASDERFMKDAEKMLYHEFAHVLGLKPEQVLPFIQEQLRAQGAPVTA